MQDKNLINLGKQCIEDYQTWIHRHDFMASFYAYMPESATHSILATWKDVHDVMRSGQYVSDLLHKLSSRDYLLPSLEDQPTTTPPQVSRDPSSPFVHQQVESGHTKFSAANPYLTDFSHWFENEILLQLPAEESGDLSAPADLDQGRTSIHADSQQFDQPAIQPTPFNKGAPEADVRLDQLDQADYPTETPQQNHQLPPSPIKHRPDSRHKLQTDPDGEVKGPLFQVSSSEKPISQSSQQEEKHPVQESISLPSATFGGLSEFAAMIKSETYQKWVREPVTQDSEHKDASNESIPKTEPITHKDRFEPFLPNDLIDSLLSTQDTNHTDTPQSSTHAEDLNSQRDINGASPSFVHSSIPVTESAEASPVNSTTERNEDDLETLYDALVKRILTDYKRYYGE